MTQPVNSNETETVSTRSRVLWITLSLMIAAMFLYAASTTTGGDQAFAGEAGASASEAMSESSGSMADASMM